MTSRSAPRGFIQGSILSLTLILGMPGRGAAEDHLNTTGPKESGFAFEVNLATSLLSLPPANQAINLNIGILQGGFFAGYKLDRFIFGLSFNLARFATGNSSAPQSEATTDTTSITIMPGVRIAALRSSDLRVELFGEFDIGYEHTFTNQSPAPMQRQDTSNHGLVYQIGPGLRYWIHPQFAFAALVGLRGDFKFQSMTTQVVGNLSSMSSSSTGITTIFAALQFLGVF